MALVVAVIALGLGGLALRRTDVVEGRVRRWLPDSAVRERVSGSAADGGAGSGKDSPRGVDPAEVAALRQRVEELSVTAPAPMAGLSRVSVVRYDAFEDLGGRLSFSAAVLDDAGCGFVLTAIHGRSETRSYLKQLPPPDDGQRELSPEENQAVKQAMKATKR